MIKKQRMLSAMMLGVALNITILNCTTQTMLSVNAEENKTITVTYYYTTTNVNVRTRPTTASKIVKTLKTL
jgi:uncharacterized protein YgiM (DUF1202 family)